MTSEARSSDCLTLKTENESLAARCDLDLSQLDGTPEQINRFLHEYAATDAEDQARRLTEGDEPPEQTAEDERLLDYIWARLDTTITERKPRNRNYRRFCKRGLTHSFSQTQAD